VVEAKVGTFDRLGIKTGDFLMFDASQNKIKNNKNRMIFLKKAGTAKSFFKKIF